MFKSELSSTLTEALTKLAIHSPSILPNIQEKLMNQLSRVLTGKNFVFPTNRTNKMTHLTQDSQPVQPVRFSL